MRAERRQPRFYRTGPIHLAAAAREAFALLRTRGPVLRRAARLCALGDALSVTRPRDWSARSNRAYWRAARLLDQRTISDGLAASRAHALLHEAQRPYHRFFCALTAATAFGIISLVAITLLLALLSPPIHAWLFPPNLALDAIWTASSASEGASVTGRSPASDGPYFFHTRSEHHPWVRIEFPRAVNVKEIRIENRTDCCRERALPLNVEVPDGSEWRLICQRRAAFATWNCHPPRISTKVVRITSPGPQPLHLKRVAVFE